MKWWRTLWYPLTRCGRSNQQQSRSSLERRGSSGGRKWGHGVRCTCIQSDHLCSLTCDCTRPQAPALCPPETWPFVIKTKKKHEFPQWNETNKMRAALTILFSNSIETAPRAFSRFPFLLGSSTSRLVGSFILRMSQNSTWCQIRYFFEYGI